MSDGAWVESIELRWLSPSDVARGAKDAVLAEKICLASWSRLTGDEREIVRNVVRATLIRLLETDEYWMVQAVNIGNWTTPNGSRSGRLDLHIVVDMDSESTRIRQLREMQLATQEARDALVVLDRELGDDA